MSASFSVGSRAILPFAVTDQAFERAVNTIFNPVVGGGVVATAFPASLRSGSMTAVFTDLAAALDFDNMLAGTAPITWSDTSTSLTIRFLADQTISLTQSDDEITLSDGTDVYVWGVSFSYQEV
ncbi:hypothetical protein Q7F20_07605 [Curtobacterium sp. A7_M15]|uniref:hypothetical protein n=1 Tax=Curtobacterium sp. A7_M15 TaxID=3065241 RepID=UPI002737BD60|nr:hypothetical protein [Curtobacterium sp. A7_M15]MDP4333234.1 hypothetical protein [Curtobacterium sp. A7_M15]